MERENVFQRMSGMRFRDKAEYIWTYYKAAVLASVVILALILTGIFRLAFPPKENVLEITAVNANPVTVDLSVLNDFLIQEGLDPARYSLSLDTSFQIDRTAVSEINDSSYQLLFARLLAKDLYLILMDPDLFEVLNGQNAFMDLSVYPIPDRSPTTAGTGDYGDASVYGIYLQDTILHQLGLYSEPVVAAVPVFSPDSDLAWDMISYLLAMSSS